MSVSQQRMHAYCTVLWLTIYHCSYQAIMVLGGVWMLGFSLLSFPFLKKRPGPSLPPVARYYSFGLYRLFHTLGKTRKLRQCFLFLLAYLVYADGYHTVTAITAIFADEMLHFTSLEAIIASLEIMVVAVVGVAFWLWLSHKWLTAKTIVMCNLVPVFITASPPTFIAFASLTVGSHDVATPVRILFSHTKVGIVCSRCSLGSHHRLRSVVFSFTVCRFDSERLRGRVLFHDGTRRKELFIHLFIFSQFLLLTL